MPTIPSTPPATPRAAPSLSVLAACVAVLLALVALPSHALYKIVGPDGKVTYTDRPQTAGQVTPMHADGRLDTQVALPAQLQQASSRFPVTLYVTSNCDPCENARRLLRQRGVPHEEKVIVSEADSQAFERLTGGRDAPTLAIGAQILHGLSPDVWDAYLDSAGYPRESRLPGNYRYPPPSPLVERQEATPAPPAAGLPHLPMATPPSPTGIRF